MVACEFTRSALAAWRLLGGHGQREKSDFALGQSPEAVALMKTGP
jgi:hypothetical protein